MTPHLTPFAELGASHCLRRIALTKLTSKSINELKTLYEKWEPSNRMSLMIMKYSITTTIHSAILDLDIMYLVVKEKVQNRVASI